ncbi:MAG: hypothetical protein KA160_10295 [Lacibacter sp.]|nr:hypothetical protein [Lacibacter sp.]
MKTLFSVLLMIIGVAVNGQVVLYSTDFGTTPGSFPTGWASSNTTNGFAAVTTSASAGYTGASGSINARFINTSTTGAVHTLTFNNSLSTIGYSNIRVIWGVRTTNTFTQSVALEWSSDGTNWNPVTFTQTANNTDWAFVNSGTPLQLPIEASNIANLRLKWSIAVSNDGNYQIDDVKVLGSYEAIVNLHREVSVTIKVEVVSE